MARFQNTQLVRPLSTFVPENLDFYQQNLDNLQKKQDVYNVSIEGLDKQTGALSNDVPGAIEAKKLIESKLQSLRSLNYNDPREQQNAIKEVSNIKNTFGPLGQLGAREEKKKAFESAQKELEKDTNDFKKAYRLNQLKQLNLSPERAIQFDSYGRPTNTDIIIPQDFEYKDKTKVFTELLKDVASDAKSVNTNLTPEKAQEALMSYMNGNIEERTGQKIYNSIKERAISDPNLMKSIEAEAEYFGKNPNDLLETALQGVVGGGKFKKSNIDKKYQQDNMAEYRAKKADDIKDLNITTSSQSEALPGSLVQIPKEIENLQFTESGDLKPITKAQYKDIVGSPNASSIPGLGGQPTFAPTNQKGFDMEANKNAVKLIKNLQEQNPDLQGLKPKQVIEAYKNSIKALESESIPLQSISNVAAKNIGDAISRNKKQRNFYLFDDKGKTSDGLLSTVLDELKIEEVDFNKALENGISGYTQGGPSSGGYYIEVPSSKGKSRRVIISPDVEVGKIFRPSQLVNEARKSFTPTEIKPFEEIPNYSILVKPNISKDGIPTWQYLEIIKDENGNIVQQNETTIDDIRKSERNKLSQSNLLGSQVNILKPNTTE